MKLIHANLAWGYVMRITHPVLLQAWGTMSVKRATWSLIALALCANLAALFVIGPGYLERYSDEVEYFERAVHFLRGGGFEGVDRTPGWPMLLAGIFRVTGNSVVAGKMLNVLAGAAIPLVVFALARLWLPIRWAWLAGAASALLPTAAVLNASLYSETVATLGFLCGNMLLFRALERARGKELSFRPMDWAGFGAAMALVNIVKPAYVLWMGMLAVAGVWYWRRVLVRYTRVVATVAVAFCLVMLPWWIRNFERTDHFVAFSTAGDDSLLLSNNPVIANMTPVLRDAGNHRITWFGPGHTLGDTKECGLVRPEEVADLDSVEKSSLYRNRALKWMVQNPGTWIILAFKKLGYGFGVWPLWQGSYRKLVAGLPFTIVCLLSLPGWWQVLKNRGSHRLLLLHPLCFVATTLLFFGSWRYRSAYEPAFVIAMLIGVRARVGAFPVEEPMGSVRSIENGS